MATIYFVSGLTREISEAEFRAIAPKLQGVGIRCFKSSFGGKISLVPVNSSTIELIVAGEEMKAIKPEVSVVKKVEETAEQEQEEEEDIEAALLKIKQEAEEAKAEVAAKKDIEEKQQEAMADLMAKSNCAHKETTIFKHITAKGDRFFPVCTFCGKRERYVKAESLEDTVKENAPVWED